MQTAANVAQEQAEADGDTSLQQRLLMGAGTTLEGASEMTDNEIASGESMIYLLFSGMSGSRNIELGALRL